MLINNEEQPQKVYNDGNKICACCDGYSDTFIYYNKFVVVETDSQDRFQDTYTLACSYSILHRDTYSSMTYEQLKSFFNPKSLITLTKSAIRQLLTLNHDININTFNSLRGKSAFRSYILYYEVGQNDLFTLFYIQVEVNIKKKKVKKCYFLSP